MKLRIGLVQSAVSEHPAENREAAAGRVREAAGLGARIVCLQELYATRYFPQEDKKDFSSLAETIPGPSTEIFSALAKELDIVVIVPLFERASEGGFFNSAVVVDADGSLCPTYRKMHIPHDPLFYEKSYFQPGDRGYQVHKTRWGSISAMICYDQWFPEAARISALQGADILFYPTAIGAVAGEAMPEGDWREAWTTIQRSHAIANGVHVAAVNRSGSEGKLNFWGSSFVCDSFGTMVARAGEADEILIADLDLELNREVREGWGFMRNRRPDSYQPLVGGKKP